MNKIIQSNVLIMPSRGLGESQVIDIEKMIAPEIMIGILSQTSCLPFLTKQKSVSSLRPKKPWLIFWRNLSYKSWSAFHKKISNNFFFRKFVTIILNQNTDFEQQIKIAILNSKLLDQKLYETLDQIACFLVFYVPWR